MGEPKRILVAVDGSQQALDALTYVAQQCSPTNTEVHLLSILPMELEEVFWQVSMGEEFMQEMRRRYDSHAAEYRREIERALEQCREGLIEAGFPVGCITISVRNWKEGIARDLISEASGGYDAIAVGRRGLGRMDSVLLGSVSNKIIQGVQELPVWVVGGPVQSLKVLLAVDSSPNAGKAVEYAGQILSHSRSELTLCHVVRGMPPVLGPTPFQPGEDLEEQLKAKLKEEVQGMFASCREQLEAQGVRPERVHSIYTTGAHSRAAELLRIARQEGFGTIIMGRRGISVVREFLMGRVTTKVLNGGEGLAVWVVP